MIKVLDPEDELNKFSIVCSSKLVAARVDSSSKEEDEMSLDNRKKGLHKLLQVGGRGPRMPRGLSLPFLLPLILLLQLTHLLLLT